MDEIQAKIRVARWLIHALVGVALLALLGKMQGMALTVVVPGILIALGSLAMVPGRPWPIHGAFGLVLSVSFWSAIPAIGHEFYTGLIPIVMGIIGVSWMLSKTDSSSFTFTIVALTFDLGLIAMVYMNRQEVRDIGPEILVKSLITTATLLIIGGLYASVGFAETLGYEKVQQTSTEATIADSTPGPSPAGSPLI